MNFSALNVALVGAVQLRWPRAEMLQRNDTRSKALRAEFGPVISVWGSTRLSYVALHARLNVVTPRIRDRGQAKADCNDKG